MSSGRLVGASAGTVVDMLAAAMVIAGIVVSKGSNLSKFGFVRVLMELL